MYNYLLLVGAFFTVSSVFLSLAFFSEERERVEAYILVEVEVVDSTDFSMANVVSSGGVSFCTNCNKSIIADWSNNSSNIENDTEMDCSVFL